VPGAGPTRHPCSPVIVASMHDLQARGRGRWLESCGCPQHPIGLSGGGGPCQPGLPSAPAVTPVSWHGKGSTRGSVSSFSFTGDMECGLRGGIWETGTLSQPLPLPSWVTPGHFCFLSCSVSAYCDGWDCPLPLFARCPTREGSDLGCAIRI